MPDAGILATLMLLAGLFLLGLEFFIPSFGMILVAAIVSLMVSFWSAYKAWWGVSPVFFWTYVVVLTVGVPGILLGAVTLIQKTALGKRMILAPSPTSDLPPNPLEKLVGRTGAAQSLMTPGGIVVIDGNRHHAESIGMLIEVQTPVKVVSVRGSRLVVRPLTDADQQEPSGVPANSEGGSPEPSAPLPEPLLPKPKPLDFDIPED
jgi:membrane-bound serine protease (ClpP class)